MVVFCGCNSDRARTPLGTGSHQMASVLSRDNNQWQPAWYPDLPHVGAQRWQLDSRRGQFVPLDDSTFFNTDLESARPVGWIALFAVWPTGDGTWWGLEGLSPLTLVKFNREPKPRSLGPPQEVPKFNAQLISAKTSACPQYDVDGIGRLRHKDIVAAAGFENVLTMSVSDTYSIVVDESGWSIISKDCVQVTQGLQDAVHIVFDLDDTVAYEVGEDVDPTGPGIITFIDPETNETLHAQILPGFVELVAWLDASPDIAVGFLSHAHPTRLVPILQAIRLPDGRSVYDVCNLVFSFQGSKNLNALRYADYRRVILIDDDRYATNQSYRNLLHLPKAWEEVWKVGHARRFAQHHLDHTLFPEAVHYYHALAADPSRREALFKMKAAEPAKGFLIAGILRDVLDAERRTPGSLLNALEAYRPATQHTLTDMQGTGPSYSDLMSNLSLQQLGLQQLQAFNASLAIPDRSWLIHEVPKATWSPDTAIVTYAFTDPNTLATTTFRWHREDKGRWSNVP
jgi:hypothetical protein